MALDYGYNEESAQQADKAADRLTDGGAYIGTFKKAYATVSREKGTHGIVLEFEAQGPVKGQAEVTLWTHDSEGKPQATWPGYAYYNSILFFLGLKNVTPEKGVADMWQDTGGGKREKVETEVDVFPQLCDRTLGLVLQKEVTDTGFRMNIYGVFDPTTRKTMTETKENAAKAAKLDRLLKGLKDKNGRTKSRGDANEPGQPSTGVDMAD